MSITIEDRGRVRIITINRPGARNAVNPETARALYEAFLDFDAEESVDVAIFTGAGDHFCAGYDLKSAATGEGQEWIENVIIPDTWSDAVTDPIPGPMGPSRLILSKPVIAAVEGYAVAGGLELAAWCDMRIAAESATFGVFCRRWGVPLIDGGTVRLPRLVGQGRANDLILIGRPVGADEAMRMGLADRVVPDGQALDQAMELAEALTRFPQECMRADHASARLSGPELAASLKREWQSFQSFISEGTSGAARFSSGKGRGGDFADI
ncbi:crotonase/enoyl-CoA hydratase family protein [uncultured Shimia sp.]|uniref:crotonase/enoyl-CoA hydratase family protein n=1 Tax=uncultured Shimia sp. TaxID=573152 RepID=UPI0026321096|nr:crotonase/enoyl-CoA hydratase family protein [uncultured Shimia sp.]